jgi:hypothetical protein
MSQSGQPLGPVRDLTNDNVSSHIALRVLQYDRNVGVHRVENTHCVQAIHVRHGLVQNDQARIQFRGFFNGIKAVYCFSTNPKICFAVKVKLDEPPDLQTVEVRLNRAAVRCGGMSLTHWSGSECEEPREIP